jgi:hypothetical protein
MVFSQYLHGLKGKLREKGLNQLLQSRLDTAVECAISARVLRRDSATARHLEHRVRRQSHWMLPSNCRPSPSTLHLQKENK